MLCTVSSELLHLYKMKASHSIIPIINDLIDDLRDGDVVFQNKAKTILQKNENLKKLYDYVRKQNRKILPIPIRI